MDVLLYLWLGFCGLCAIVRIVVAIRDEIAIQRLASCIRWGEQPRLNPMMDEEFRTLIRALETDGWTYDPVFYRFTKQGKPDYSPDRAPRYWPAMPGENIASRGYQRAHVLRRAA